MLSNLHALRRTSPKGQEFIGECMLCGDSMTAYEAMKTTCINPNKVTQQQALFKVLENIRE